MRQLWLVLDRKPHTPLRPPSACPHPGCGGRRFRLHQAVVKAVRGLARGGVTARRYACLECGRTFRVYPAGIDRGQAPICAKRFAAALRFLGLPYRDVSRALTVLGIPLGKSQAHAAAAPLLRDLALRAEASLLERVEIDAAIRAGGRGPAGDMAAKVDDGNSAGNAGAACDDAAVDRAAAADDPAAWVWIGGCKLALRRAVDVHGRTALVIDGIDGDTRLAVEAWAAGPLASLGVRAEVAYVGVNRRQVRALPADWLLAIDDGVVPDVVDGLGDCAGSALCPHPASPVIADPNPPRGVRWPPEVHGPAPVGRRRLRAHGSAARLAAAPQSGGRRGGRPVRAGCSRPASSGRFTSAAMSRARTSEPSRPRRRTIAAAGILRAAAYRGASRRSRRRRPLVSGPPGAWPRGSGAGPCKDPPRIAVGPGAETPRQRAARRCRG